MSGLVQILDSGHSAIQKFTAQFKNNWPQRNSKIRFQFQARLQVCNTITFDDMRPILDGQGKKTSNAISKILQKDVVRRPVRGLIIARGEGKFVLLQFAFWSPAMTCLFVPSKAKGKFVYDNTLYRPLLYRAVRELQHETFSRTACLSQPVFSGTKAKLQNLPSESWQKGKLKQYKLAFPSCYRHHNQTSDINTESSIRS